MMCDDRSHLQVRNHHPVPVVASDAHVMQVEVPRADGTTATLAFTADELRTRFPKHVVRATIQCMLDFCVGLDFDHFSRLLT